MAYGSLGYDLVKVAHIVSLVAWMAGMLYLPRLFVYHADAEVAEATHRRRMSAPDCLMTSCGATMLPSDFDILRPSSSSTKPWVSTTS